MASSTWAHVTTPEPMSVTEALQEVFKDITPCPVSVEATITALCTAIDIHTLTTRNEYMAFLHLVIAAVHKASATPRLQGDVKDALRMFCQRRGIKIDAIG